MSRIPGLEFEVEGSGPAPELALSTEAVSEIALPTAEVVMPDAQPQDEPKRRPGRPRKNPDDPKWEAK